MSTSCGGQSMAPMRCSTTSPRCRSPRIPTCCARSTSTAPRTCSPPAGPPASPKSCTPRRAPSSGSRRATRSCRRRSRSQPSHTATPSWPPSGRACRGVRRPRRDDRPAPHDPGARSPRHLRDPLRLDRRRRRPVRARRRFEPLPVPARRRSGQRLPARRHQTRAGRVQRRHRPLRHDARGAGTRLPTRRHRCSRAQPAHWPNGSGDARRARHSASRPSRRITG